MMHTKQPLADRQSSAVSQVMKIIRDEKLRPLAKTPTDAKSALEHFDLHATGDFEMRQRAFHMAYTVYHKKGYIPRDARESLAASYDTRPDTLVSVALDKDGVAAGTISLVFDAPQGLPCDEIFHRELTELRNQGRWLVEVTRLAIDDRHAHNKPLLALLCNIPFAFAARIRGYTDLLVEVNPRHVPFYRRLLQFKVIGSERPCPRVNGAPAVLLRADLDEYLEAMRLLKKGTPPKSTRSLFPQFLGEQDEIAMVERLASQQRAMTITEMRYFGLEMPGALRAEMTACSA